MKPVLVSQTFKYSSPFFFISFEHLFPIYQFYRIGMCIYHSNMLFIHVQLDTAGASLSPLFTQDKPTTAARRISPPIIWIPDSVAPKNFQLTMTAASGNASSQIVAMLALVERSPR